MKQTKRITSLVLSLVMLMTLAMSGVWTPHVHAEENTILEDFQVVYINPLYADVITEADLVEPDHTLLYADNTGDGKYYDAKTAGEMIRDDLVARDVTIAVNLTFPYNEETIQEDAQDQIFAIISKAMVHTGKPVEGDYLLWHLGGLQAEGTNATFDSTGKNVCVTVTYTMTYHSNAAQEAEMNTAVSKLLGEMNVANKDNYTKLKTIYDYITANVTYDHANASNNNYTLKHTAYAALINKTAVCQGYAALLYRLALELGVDCRLIPGDSSGQGHGWNIAKIGNLYYNLDSTWDAGLTPAQYQCFLKGSKDFRDHARWDKPGELPTEDNYNSEQFHAAYPMSENNYVPGCAHEYTSKVTTAATCTEKGVKTFTCSICGNSYTETIPSTGHTYDKEEVVAPTCDKKGYTVHTCSGCGDTYQDTMVDALGHSYDSGVITKESTCGEAGVKTYTCATCKGTYEEELPLLDHVYDKTQLVAPTCTEKGYTIHLCSGCGASYKDAFVDATGHIYDSGVITTAPTCTEAGVKTFSCTQCDVYYEEPVDALLHAYDNGTVATPATCTEHGIRVHTCTRCGDQLNAIIDALGHTPNEGTVTVVPTCTETGIMTYVCTVCNETYTEVLPLAAHTYEGGVCTHCGKIMLVAPEILSCYSKQQTSVKVTWTPVEGAAGYEIWRSTKPEDDTSWAVVKTVKDGTADRYTNQGLEKGVTYYYAVRAYAEEKDGKKVYSEFSNMDYMPAAVVWDAPYSNATTRIRLRWKEVTGAHGYQIWRQNEDETWSIVKTLGDKGNVLTDNQGATTAYSNTGLTAGKTYTYMLRSFMINEDGRKVFGAYSDAFTVAVMPQAPVITVTSPKATRAQVEWKAIDGAAGYQVWMQDTRSSAGWAIVKSVTDGSTTYTKYDLKSGAQYQFKVRAYTEVDGKKTFGEYSEVITVTVK